LTSIELKSFSKIKMEIEYKNLNNPIHAVKWPFEGLRLLMKPGFRQYIWGPILINFLFYSLAFWTATEYFSSLLSWLIPDWLSWLEWLIWPIFFTTLVLITFFTFTLFANLLAAPFYGKLAEKTEEYLLGGKPVPNKSIPLAKGIISSMASEIRRLSYFLFRAIPLLILFIIPGVNLLAPILWILFSAWFLALEYMSYPLEEHAVSFSEQRKQVKNFRLGAIAFGGITMLGLSIPILNILVPPAVVVGATAYILSGEHKKANASH